MAKVSVIVPVYNSENTLVNAVGCLINQTLKDIEIVLVNDASTDNSWTIMQLLEERFPNNIMIINSTVNQGAGGARNIGLSYATGDYIGFMDADDIVDTTMYEKLYNEAIRTGYDIIDCGFYKEADDLAIIFTSDELSGKLTPHKRNELISSGGYIVTKLFKRDYLYSHDFTFRHNVILEDSEIIAYAMATAESIGNVKEVLYIYKDYSDSSSKIIEPTKYYNSCYNAMTAIYEKLSVLPNYNDIRESVEYEMLQMYSYTINCLLANKNNNSKEDIISKLEVLRDFRLRNITKGYDNKYVRNKISNKDIELMMQNDASAIRLYDKVMIK